VKTRKLIDRIRALFNEDLRNSHKIQQALHEVLEKLRKKEKKLCALLEAEQDADKRERLQMKIDLVHSQRKKGIDKLKQVQQAESS
jgi:hypothetical protein